jgi:hypothetical protein
MFIIHQTASLQGAPSIVKHRDTSRSKAELCVILTRRGSSAQLGPSPVVPYSVARLLVVSALFPWRFFLSHVGGIMFSFATRHLGAPKLA